MEVKSMSLRLAGHVACTGEKINAYLILAGKPEGNRCVGRPRCRREDNIQNGT
jgi:hypothetical protein